MSSQINRLKKIVSSLRTPKEAKKEPSPITGFSLEELVAITRRKSLALEERIPRSETLMSRSEVLYRLDPLIWSGVNKLSRLVASPRIFFTGQIQEDVTAMEIFVDSIGLRTILPFLIKDIFIYGYGVAEIIRDNGKIVRVVQIDPKSFDYQRIDGTNYIKRNKDGSIVGYKQSIVGQEDKLFNEEDVIILRFYVLGEECLGMTPLEPVYKAAWIKLNLEEALGEAVFRHGYPIYWYKLGTLEAQEKGFEVTPELVKEAESYLQDMTTANEIIIPWWITPGRLDAKSEIGDLSTFLQYLSAEIMAGLEVPKVYGTTTQNIQANVSQETLDFEKTVRTMQEVLTEQLDYQLFSPYRKEGAKFSFPYPKMNFTEYSEETKMFRSRRLSQYAKYNLLTPDENLENDIRRIEGLSDRQPIPPKESCVFGYGECPVRKHNKVTLEKLAKFCVSCAKNKKSTVEVPAEEETEEIEEGKEDDAKLV